MNLQCVQELWVNSQEGEGDVGRSAAVIFGVPTCVGNMSWQVKKWLGTNWNVQVGGKLGSAFSTDNSPNGGGTCLLYTSSCVKETGHAPPPTGPD